MTQLSYQFPTHFDCRESNYPDEYITDVKEYVKESSEFLNYKKTPVLDLSTLGLGFVVNNFLTKNYEHILTLNVSRNNIKTLNTMLNYYPNIQELDISNNCLISLNIEHRKLVMNRALVNINFSNNLIKDIHPFFFSSLSLEFIDLSNNRLTRFLAANYEINQLLLNNNKISQIVIDAEHRKELRLLDASHNSVRIVQANVDFETLLLKDNRVQLDDYFEIRNVRTLDLSQNQIDNFNWQIMSYITNLNLSLNRLTTISGWCSKGLRYPRVEKLNLNGNAFCHFDNIVNITYCLPNLKFISLLNNKFNRKTQEVVKSMITSMNVKSQLYDNDFQTLWSN
ncbi:unnamed protein product [Diamesa tonsa]